MGTERKKVGLISSPGGHLTEMLAVKEVFQDADTFHVTYRSATPGKLADVYFIENGWFRNPVEVLFLIWYRAFVILAKERPDALFSTGAEIAIPFFILGKFFFGCKLAYLECSAQVNTPSLTGRILYHISDLFLVQWEPLLSKYGPRAKYRGGLI